MVGPKRLIQPQRLIQSIPVIVESLELRTVSIYWIKWSSPKTSTEIRRLRRPQFVVARCHNIPESQRRLFAAESHHSCLWPEAKRFDKSQIPATARTDGRIILVYSLCNIIDVWTKGIALPCSLLLPIAVSVKYKGQFTYFIITDRVVNDYVFLFYWRVIYEKKIMELVVVLRI